MYSGDSRLIPKGLRLGGGLFVLGSLVERAVVSDYSIVGFFELRFSNTEQSALKVTR